MKTETDKRFDLLNEAISLRSRSIQLTMGLVKAENRDDFGISLHDDAVELGRRMAKAEVPEMPLLDNDELVGGIVGQAYAEHAEYLEWQRRGSKEAWDALLPEEQYHLRETFHDMCAIGNGDAHQFYHLLMNEWLSSREPTLKNDFRASAPLTSSQLANNVSQLDCSIHQGTNSIPEAVGALMRCAPADLPASQRIVLKEAIKRAFETGQGLSEVLKEFTQPQQKQELKQKRDRAQTL